MNNDDNNDGCDKRLTIPTTTLLELNLQRLKLAAPALSSGWLAGTGAPTDCYYYVNYVVYHMLLLLLDIVYFSYNMFFFVGF